VRVLFTSLPGIGHLHPLLPVARGLAARGHAVAFAVSEPFRTAVAAAGFDDHHPVGVSWTTADLPVRFPELGAIPPGPARYQHARAHVFAGALPFDVVDDLARLIRHWRADVVVRESAELGGYLAAERCGVPHVMVRTDSGSALYSERHVMADSLDAVRARLGLPPDPGAEHPFDHLQIAAAPPIMDDPVLPATWHHVRPTVESGNAHAPDWLDGLGARGPVVYATLGTVHSGPDLLAAIVAAVASAGVELVVTTGPVDPAALGPQPGNVRLARWIPQADLLGRCDAVVTHAGFGTMAAALTHGVPLVMLPISADQPMNARRAAAAGVGIELAPADRTVGAIRAAVDAVLADPRFATASIAAAAQAAAQPPLDHALDLVEALVTTQALSCVRC
jgi:UDP:flavonoid glycosyltransferase YjiC (YdhE family)